MPSSSFYRGMNLLEVAPKVNSSRHHRGPILVSARYDRDNVMDSRSSKNECILSWRLTLAPRRWSTRSRARTRPRRGSPRRSLPTRSRSVVGSRDDEDCAAHRDRLPLPSLWSLHDEKEPQRSADDARARSDRDAMIKARPFSGSGSASSPLSHDKEQPHGVMVGSGDDGSAAFHETLL